MVKRTDKWQTEKHVRNLYIDYLEAYINDTENDDFKKDLYQLISYSNLTADFVIQLLGKIHAISVNGVAAKGRQSCGPFNGFSDN